MKHLFIFLPLLILVVACKHSTIKSKTYSVDIPQKNEVGVKLLPTEIAKVEAPFSIIEFTKPVFPDDTVCLKLKKDSINTSIIQKAINHLSLKGGGVIVVPVGNWLSGRIILKDNVNLHFNDGAAMTFSGNIEDYQPAVFSRFEGVEVMSFGACIYANNAKNIAITGNGKLIGPKEGFETQNIPPVEFIDMDKPVAERIVDGVHTKEVFPPMFISPINCTKVFIEGISLENTAFWNIVPVYCDNVIIRGVTVNSVGIPRGDGIDIESTKNVLIEYCNLSCGDDCFTMKAGRGEDGIRVNKPTENVVVRNCLALKGHGGVTCGSETAGVIRNLYVHDCVFIDSGVGVRFKTRRPRGGGGENLYYERVRMDLYGDAFKWDMLGSRKYVGNLADRLPFRQVTKLTPYYKNIHIKDIVVENASCFIKAKGIPESPINNVTIENAQVKCKKAFFAHDIHNLTINKIKIESNDTLLTFIDSRNVKMSNLDFNTPVCLHIEGECSDSVSVASSVNIKDTVYVISVSENGK